jgi:hypothetical protein
MPLNVKYNFTALVWAPLDQQAPHESILDPLTIIRDPHH